MQNSDRVDDQKRRLTIRIVLCAAILLIGVGGFGLLASLKKPPAEVETGERPLKVKVLAVTSRTVPVTISGYGQVQALNSVRISAEVAGQVVLVHPDLETGETVAQGELLLQVDTRTYAAAVDQAQAEVSQWGSVLERLHRQADIDAGRLKTLERNQDLAKAEFDRINDLFSVHSVGTRSGVDRAEQAYNAAIDQADQMAQAVALYPIRTKETQSSLAAAKARLQQAKANLERCRISAPFSGRLTQVAVEQGQYVAPGQVLATLADDNVLEIRVPLDSRDVRQWLRFAPSKAAPSGAWFGQPEPVTSFLRWTENKEGHVWHGVLDRIVDFDQKTRTVTVAVRIKAKAALAGDGGLPLVAGMFCQVEIPGRNLDHAFQVPRAVVSYKNTVFIAKDQRLKTVAVQVARVEGDYAYITGGLDAGDRVIVTRLVDPLENSLLEIIPDRSEG
jgi:multidrug efflux system membrane fusion protein